MLDWTTCKAAFHTDGSLTDIYVQGTTVQDWQRFLDFAARDDCSFFCGTELDPDPGEVRSQRALDIVAGFPAELGRALQKDGGADG